MIICVDINKYFFSKISNFCDNLFYDFGNKELHVKCPTISYGNALIAIVLQFINGKISYWRMVNYPVIKSILSKDRLQNESKQEFDISIIKFYLKTQDSRS